MNKWGQAGLVALLMYGGVSCGNGGEDGAKWKPAPGSAVYEVCYASYGNLPCVQRGQDDAKVWLYRAHDVPVEVMLLYVEKDGRWRVVVK